MTKKDLMMIDQGALIALEKIDKYNQDGINGVEELRRQVRRRGLTRIPLRFSDDYVDKVILQLTENMYNMALPSMLMTLEEEFGFTDQQLRAVHDGYLSKWSKCVDLDCMGEQYVTLEDYVNELNEKYGYSFDPKVAGNCDRQIQDDVPYHFVKVERIIEILERDGYPAAALHLKKKIGG